MKSRKSIKIKLINQLAEQRYLDNKFTLKEDEDNGLPEFQVTPEGLGKYKIKYTWNKIGTKLPKDVRDDKFFSDKEFEPLTKIYVDQKEAQMAVDNFLRTKTYLFKK
jgi:hypothetical protein